MLTSSTNLRPLNPALFLKGFTSLFQSKTATAPHTHGTARYVKVGSAQLHQQTEITMAIGSRETDEAFIDRVHNEADEGDWIEYRRRDGKMVGASITRKADQALRMRDDETLKQFTARVKMAATANNLPRA